MKSFHRHRGIRLPTPQGHHRMRTSPPGRRSNPGCSADSAAIAREAGDPGGNDSCAGLCPAPITVKLYDSVDPLFV